MLVTHKLKLKVIMTFNLIGPQVWVTCER